MRTPSPLAVEPRQLLAVLQSQQPEMVTLLRQLVEHESPSDDKHACDRIAESIAGLFDEIGGRTKLHLVKDRGNHLQIDFPGANGQKPVLIVGHFDTVYPTGTLQRMPWRQTRDRLCGPGVLDMKGGIVQVRFAIAALLAAGKLPRPVTIILVSDEEVGSESSRAITERLAKQSTAALVCEPAAGEQGALKTARKGVGDFLVHVQGVASHAGLDFEKGQSAILELAHQIQTVSGFTDLRRGITVNPGIIRGGTRTNVVAAEAEVAVDVRLSRKQDAERVVRNFRGLKAKNRRCTLNVSGGINRLPMERTKGTAELFQKARTIAKDLGFALTEKAVGGGSDGNFTGPIIPTLDGLGAVGDGAHASHEFIFAREMPKRAALLASLILAI